MLLWVQVSVSCLDTRLTIATGLIVVWRERERERARASEGERVARARPQDILLGFVGELLGLGDLREAAADGEPVLAAARGADRIACHAHAVPYYTVVHRRQRPAVEPTSTRQFLFKDICDTNFLN